MAWYNSNGAERSDNETSSLHKALEYALKGYDNHTNWFQRHRDAAVRQLGLILGAELVILRLFLDSNSLEILGGFSLLLLAGISPLLGLAGIKSCERAYVASIEHAAMSSKILWALFPEKIVNISSLESNPPLKNDEYLSIPRYIKDAQRFESTDEYVKYHLGKPVSGKERKYKNTLFWAKLVIGVLGTGCFIFGAVGGIYLLFK